MEQYCQILTYFQKEIEAEILLIFFKNHEFSKVIRDFEKDHGICTEKHQKDQKPLLLGKLLMGSRHGIMFCIIIPKNIYK